MSKAESAEQLRARLQSIDPYEFEHFVADLWEDQGWDTTVSDSSRDQGVDVEARKRDGAVDQKAVIQVKRYSDGNKVGQPKVQQYHSMKVQDPKADVAIVVTTSEFTTDACLWGMRNNVKLVDGEDLADMIRQQDRYDLVDEYAPDPDDSSGKGLVDSVLDELEKDDEQNPTSSTATSSRSSSRSSQDQSVGFENTDYFIFVAAAFVAHAGGSIVMVSPSAVPLLSGGMGFWIGFFGWLVTPIVVFADAHELHVTTAEYRPSRIAWPAIVFFVPILGTLLYFRKRMPRSDFGD